MDQNAVGRWSAGGGVQMLSGSSLMLGICSLSVLESCMKHCLCLFLCMAVRQCYGKRMRDLELGLYRWTTPGDCKVYKVLRMDKVPNARIRELCGLKKGLDERIHEGVLR